jgi:hypothetical protein
LRLNTDLTTPVQSSSTTYTIDVTELNDLPVVQSQTISLLEDGLAEGGYTVQLNLSDAETGSILDGYITKLPSKGKLYALDSSSGNLTEISAAYNPFDVQAIQCNLCAEPCARARSRDASHV